MPAAQLLSFLGYLIGAAAACVGAVFIARNEETWRRDKRPMLIALALSAGWASLGAALGPDSIEARMFAAARDLAWLFVIYRLFANDGRSHTQIAVPLLAAVLGFVTLLQPAVILLAERSPTALQVSWSFHLIVAIGALVLLHNLYLGAAMRSRVALQWTIAGIGMYWIFELNLFLSAALSGQTDPALNALRGIVLLPLAVCVGVGATAQADNLRLRTSRAVTFRLLSLSLIGLYLAAMAGLTWLAARFGGDIARIVQIGSLVAALAASVALLPSRRFRGWTRVMLLKHLFRHRYDYRAEWLRFTETIGNAGQSGGRSLHERVAKALADITESPAAVLFLPNDQGELGETANWRWSNLAEGGATLPEPLCDIMERRNLIVDVAGETEGSPGMALPDWLRGEQRAWAIVPLLHFGGLTGAVLLARPDYPRKLDWEDFDLLKIVGRQLASHLAEEAGQRALLEAAQFDDFSRRMAFVMHDIKNLASQLSLLARNAERHAENPAFRKDMLVTLRTGSDRLQTLLARLGRYGTGGQAECRPIDLVSVARNVVSRFTPIRPLVVAGEVPCLVMADGATLEQAIVHLTQNAIDASDPGEPVLLDIQSDERGGILDIVDAGSGMTADFIRDGLFKPFVSSKQGGFGIGALEARELVAAMGGRLEVQSRTGTGTRFTIVLPLAQADEHQQPGNEAAAA
ncbi:PEP-CTERM system histidine kinase PrsK [Erythrobacter sp. 3-20A1M]|nr:PEP-CTERM system histidine kinase PrsK [Erythrobacter sp. 3-20A1M]